MDVKKTLSVLNETTTKETWYFVLDSKTKFLVLTPEIDSPELLTKDVAEAHKFASRHAAEAFMWKLVERWPLIHGAILVNVLENTNYFISY